MEVRRSSDHFDSLRADIRSTPGTSLESRGDDGDGDVTIFRDDNDIDDDDDNDDDDDDDDGETHTDTCRTLLLFRLPKSLGPQDVLLTASSFRSCACVRRFFARLLAANPLTQLLQLVRCPTLYRTPQTSSPRPGPSTTSATLW